MAGDGLPFPLSLLSSAPDWLKASILFFFPAIVAIALLGVLLGWIPSTLMAATLMEKVLDEHSKVTKEEAVMSIRLLRQICMNTARTELGRDTCNR